MPHTLWTIDTSHSAIAFSARHLVIAKVRGVFGDWSGSVSIDDGDPGATHVEVRIQASSIDTKEAQRDAHLRSADFLDVESHPEIVFTSTRAEARGAGKLRLIGDLTIRGASREVTLDAKYVGAGVDPWGTERRAYTGTASVDRRRWGLVWNAPLEAGGFLVGDTVDLDFDVQIVRAEEA